MANAPPAAALTVPRGTIPARTSDVVSQVQRRSPASRHGDGRPRLAIALDAERIAPVVRIAHRLHNPLDIPRRVIVDHEFVLFLDGRGEFVLGRRRWPIVPHALFFVPPFVPHRIRSTPGAPCEHVAVHFDLSPEAVPDPEQTSLADRPPYRVKLSHGLRVPSCVVLAPGDRIEATLLELLRAHTRVHPLARAEARARLIDVLADLLTRFPRAARRRSTGDGQADDGATGSAEARVRRLVARAIDHMSAHFAEPIEPADLAAVAGLSPSHFNRSFRRRTGYAPMEYLRRLRVDRARALLGGAPELSIKQIAARTGFDDAYHFSRVFRQVTGLPPSRYREMLLSAGR